MLWLITPWRPSGLTPQAWEMFAIFVATIVGCITKPLPIGSTTLLGMVVTVLVGIAPVKDETGAYHIDENGQDLYKQRYSRVFGFYCNRASVINDEAWFHIDEKGNRIYSNSYTWTGNFQENSCTVRV